MMKTFIFYIDGLDREVSIEAETMKEARQKSWNLLTDAEQNSVIAYDCIEVIDPTD